MAQKVKAFPLFNLLPYKSSGWLLNHGDFYSAFSSYSRQLADVNGDAHADIIDFGYDKTLQVQKTLEAIKPEIEAKEVLVYAIDEVHLPEGDLINHLWGSSQERLHIPRANEKNINFYRTQSKFKPHQLENNLSTL